MKSMGLELPGMGAAGGGGGGVGGVGGEGGGRKREVLMRDARYGVGSILVEEGAGPTSVFLIVEGECRIIKGKPRTQSAGENRCTKRSASILRVFPVFFPLHKYSTWYCKLGALQNPNNVTFMRPIAPKTLHVGQMSCYSHLMA